MVTAVRVPLSPAALAALQQRVRMLEVLFPRAQASPGLYLRAVLQQHLAERKAAQQALAGELLTKYWPVARAVAAKWFRRLQGAVPLAELDSAAFNEITTAAHKFDASLGYSPAPYFRRWAEWGIQALLRQRNQDQALIHPDQDQEDEAGTRWERLGARDETLEEAPARAEQRRAVLAFLRQQDGPHKRALGRLARGEDDDTVARATGLDLAELALLREALATALGTEEDEEATPADAAAAARVPLKVVYKALATGQLDGRKRDGAWVLRAADVRAWVRRREAGR